MSDDWLIKPPLPYKSTHGPLCPICLTGFGMGFDQMRSYFNGEDLPCRNPACSHKIDCWAVVRELLSKDIPSAMFSMIKGAKTTRTEKTLVRNQGFRLVFEQHNIPSGSKILNVEFRSNDDSVLPVAMPIEKGMDFIPFYTVPLKDDRPFFSPVYVETWITWSESKKNDFMWSNLVSALEAFKDERFIDVIVPANVIVEVKIREIVPSLLNPLVPDVNDLKHVLSPNGFGNKYTLMVLMPIGAAYYGAPAINKVNPDIIKFVSALNIHRNKVAHWNNPKIAYDRQEVGDWLCAAVFVASYIDLLTEHFDVYQTLSVEERNDVRDTGKFLKKRVG